MSEPKIHIHPIPSPSVTFVTAFIDLNEDRSQDRTPETRIVLFRHIANSGISICLYVSSKYETIGKELENEYPNVKLMPIINLEDLDTYKLIISYSPELPTHRNVSHDTVNFLILMNSKTEFLYKTTLSNPFNTDHFSWIDFSIFHIVNDIENVKSILYLFGYSKLKTQFLVAPSCWSYEKSKNIINSNTTTITSTIHWRFCGGFIIGDKTSIQNMHLLIYRELPNFIKHTSKNIISWEVNIWAWIEHYCNWHIDSYISDHNDTMILYIPKKYISVDASLTSIPPRIEQCKLVIDSIINQVDNVYLNLCSTYSRFTQFTFEDIKNMIPYYFLSEEPYKSKLKIIYGNDYGPATKYLGALSTIDKSQWIFVCDDDQEYQTNLIQTMVNNINLNNNNLNNNNLNKFGIYQNRYNIVKHGSGGIIHGYVGNLIHSSLIKNLKDFDLPDFARYVDDQWLSIYCFLNNINIYPSGIEEYKDIFSVLNNGFEKIGCDSLASLNNRDSKIKELENYYSIKFINNGNIIKQICNTDRTGNTCNIDRTYDYKNMYKATIVTFYFNIKKLADATSLVRPQSFYMEKGRETLKLNYPMVIFCDETTYDEIKTIRDEYVTDSTLTHYIIKNITEYDFYKENIAKITHNRIHNSNYENSRNTPSYYLVTMFKIMALDIAKENNFYNTDYYAWIDFGGSHIMKDFNHSAIKMLENPNPKISLCYIHYRTKDEMYKLLRTIGGFCGIAATSFTIETNYIKPFYDTTFALFYELLNNGIGHAEEQILTLFYDKYPELCTLYYGDYYSILQNYHEPLQDFMCIIYNYIKETINKGRKDLALACAISIMNSIHNNRAQNKPIQIDNNHIHYLETIINEANNSIVKKPIHVKEYTSNINKYIDKVIYVNLESRKDRRTEIETELNNYNIDYERFNAVATPDFGIIGCTQSHLEIFKMAKEKGYKNILIFEDDFMFVVSKEKLEEQIHLLFNSNETSGNTCKFDVCMLSYNLIKSKECSDYPFLKKVLEVQTTAGYIINESMYDKLIDLYTWSIPLLTNTRRHWIYALDQIWKLLQPISKWYCFDIRIGKQRPSYSDLGNKWNDPEY